ncbi:hypothetical protein ACM66B_003646 [Microbotryomycetes sp. NB124-2]
MATTAHATKARQAQSPSRQTTSAGLIHLPQQRQQPSPSPRKRASKSKQSQIDDLTSADDTNLRFSASFGVDDNVRAAHGDDAHEPRTRSVTPRDTSTHSTAPSHSSTPPVTSPTKAKRTKGRNSSRQSSPPLAPAAVAHAQGARTDSDSQSYSSSTQLATTYDALAPSSSSDEWDMPAIDTLAVSQRTKDVLTWQQQSLSRSNSTSTDSKRNSSKQSHKQPAQRDARPGGDTHSKSSRQLANKPQSVQASSNASPISHSAPVSSALTWQQELLQQSDSANANITPNSGRSSTPQKGISPAKLRRQQQKDQETFGLGALDLATNDASAHATPKRALGQRGAQNGAQQPKPRPAPTNGSGSPLTPSKPTEERYAGPTFHNSPLASSLPTPSFLLRKKQALETGMA